MTARNYPGFFIVFEGTDGTGKTTQLKMLAKELQTRGLQVEVTREPTDGHYGRIIRKLYVERDKYSREEELQLFLDDRREHVNDCILPALQSGRIVLCDRYFLSTVAYQGAIGFVLEEILDRNSFAPPPDIAFLLTAPLEQSLERITSGRGDTLNDFEKQDSLRKVASIFDSLNQPYISRIDASKSLQQVHETILNQTLDSLRETQLLPEKP